VTRSADANPSRDRLSRRMISVVAFVGGFVSIGLELTASR
jgi:hypothetical protein